MREERRGPVVTIGICVLLTLLFLVDVFLLVPEGVPIWTKEHLIQGDKLGYLTQNLKLVTSKVLQGQLWRPLTSMFLHAGVVHLLFNLICLLQVGTLVEGQVGGGKTLLFFLLSGLFSALCVMALTRTEDGLGASTAIFGLLGVLLVLFWRQGAPLLAQLHPVNWLLLAAMVVLGNATDGITRLEHLTGTVGGILLALLLL